MALMAPISDGRGYSRRRECSAPFGGLYTETLNDEAWSWRCPNSIQLQLIMLNCVVADNAIAHGNASASKRRGASDTNSLRAHDCGWWKSVLDTHTSNIHREVVLSY
jgi:hypothetical protein